MKVCLMKEIEKLSKSSSFSLESLTILRVYFIINLNILKDNLEAVAQVIFYLIGAELNKFLDLNSRGKIFKKMPNHSNCCSLYQLLSVRL